MVAAETQLAMLGAAVELRTRTRRLESVMMAPSCAPVLEIVLAVKFPDAGAVLDVTYGRGRLWTGTRRSVVGFDLVPRCGAVAAADARWLPVRDGAVDVVVFDPPFLAETRGWLYGDWYGSGLEDVDGLFGAVAAETRRVGRLGAVWKVQDVVEAHRVRWLSVAVHEAYRGRDARVTEQIVYVPSGGRPDAWNHDEPKHARRVHSYLVVVEWAPRRRSKARRRRSGYS